MAELKAEFIHELNTSVSYPLPKDTDNVDNSDGETEITGEAIIALMSMSDEVDLSKVLLTASKLFISPNIALVDGEMQLKQSFIDDMDYDDLEEATGKYLANFILASSLNKMKNKSKKK